MSERAAAIGMICIPANVECCDVLRKTGRRHEAAGLPLILEGFSNPRAQRRGTDERRADGTQQFVARPRADESEIRSRRDDVGRGEFQHRFLNGLAVPDVANADDDQVAFVGTEHAARSGLDVHHDPLAREHLGLDRCNRRFPVLDDRRDPRALERGMKHHQIAPEHLGVGEVQQLLGEWIAIDDRSVEREQDDTFR